MKTHNDASKHANSVRISFRGPAISEHHKEAGQDQQQTFPDTGAASDWIVMHIPETERHFVKMWIDGTPLTGATLDATLRPFPSEH